MSAGVSGKAILFSVTGKAVDTAVIFSFFNSVDVLPGTSA